ncbi:MAG: hypothetical protein ACLSFT_11610 [Ruminococcus callidus]
MTPSPIYQSPNDGRSSWCPSSSLVKISYQASMYCNDRSMFIQKPDPKLSTRKTFYMMSGRRHPSGKLLIVSVLECGTRRGNNFIHCTWFLLRTDTYSTVAAALGPSQTEARHGRSSWRCSRPEAALPRLADEDALRNISRGCSAARASTTAV